MGAQRKAFDWLILPCPYNHRHSEERCSSHQAKWSMLSEARNPLRISLRCFTTALTHGSCEVRLAPGSTSPVRAC
jgi:hypothetical protein